MATLVNGTRWTLSVYLNQDSGTSGKVPSTILRPGGSIQIAFLAGRHTLTPPDRGPAQHAAPGELEPTDRD